MIEKIDELSSQDNIVYEVSCDSCSFSEEIEVFNFPCLMNEMRQRGWKSFKDGDDEWTQMCSECCEKKEAK